MRVALTLLVITYSVIVLCAADLRPDCKNNVKNSDSFVCVCTEAEPCAPIEGPDKAAAGVVTRWESSRDGARLSKTVLHFGNSTVPAGQGQLSIKVNREVKYQEIFGFGGAFTDASGINLKKVSAKLGDQILRDYFSKDGLEYNVGRIPIGGSDFSARNYSLDDNQEDKTLAKFNLTAEDVDYKIPFILKAKSLATHEIRLFGSPWSAPKWMKTNNDLSHGGSIKGTVGSEYWQIYAKYFVHYLDSYKAHNISHWGITIQNEPYAVTQWNTMYYTPEMMRDFLANTLGPELERSGYGSDKLKVMIYDHNLDHVLPFVKTIFADPAAAKYAQGTAVHWYMNSGWEHLDEAYKMDPDKFILATEACVGPGVKLGHWPSAERYGWDIIQIIKIICEL